MAYEHQPYIRLHLIEKAEPIAASWGVSEVSRSPRGFLSAYKLTSGNPYAMGRDQFTGRMWEELRMNFIRRHMSQAKKKKERMWKGGNPSRRHLSLIMWAYTPTPAKTAAWLHAI